MPGRSHTAWAALSAALKHYVLVCVQEFCVSFLVDTYSVAVFIEKRVHTGLAGADDPVVRYTTAMPLSTQMGTVFSQSVGGHKPPAAPLRDQFLSVHHTTCAPLLQR